VSLLAVIIMIGLGMTRCQERVRRHMVGDLDGVGPQVRDREEPEQHDEPREFAWPWRRSRHIEHD
jgi:hypothetical protein